MRASKFLIAVGGLLIALVAFGLLFVNGCAGTGGPDDLPKDESRIQVLDATPPAAAAPADGPLAASSPPTPAVEPAPTPPDGPFQRLTLGGTRGGQITFVLPGTPSDVAAMYVDFDDATGHRPSAKSLRVVSQSEEGVVAEWNFHGKMGISPVVHIEYKNAPQGEGYRIRFKLVKKAFGISRYFGDYQLEPFSANPPRTRVTARLFIDSGVPFGNASHQDIEDGFRADAKSVRAWMKHRLGVTPEPESR